ncbi:MAG: BMP family ABC transporter substrate-binding protein [Lachnospiraceae bacterium]|nr:BMP family ABC transporter substrate-binding protein [Lachnospiraceae bacterium]
MKKLVSLLLTGAMVFSLVACGNNAATEEPSAGENVAEGTEESTAIPADFKVGAIMLGDENEGYTFAHIDGIKKACEALGVPEDQVVWKYNISEDASCYDAAMDLVDAGCNVIFSNSYGHQTYMQQAAAEVPDVTFVAMTGDTATVSGLPNLCNAFTNVYESRYVSGVVAGMKIAEMDAKGEIPAVSIDADGNVKIGYVGAYPYAEVVSGYTAFYLGVKSVYENVVMEVSYTNSWFDITAEGEAAKALMSDGCLIIGQHADSTGAPAAVQAAHEAGTVAYSVGYNVDMLSVAPDVALTSATNNWSVYYEYAIATAAKGEAIPQNWAKGYAEDAVKITELGSACAEGTAEKVAEVEAALKDGSLHVFDTSKFTVGGATLDEYVIDLTGDFDTDDEEDQNAIWDGYFHESEFRSAPSFDIRVDGITELN